MNIHDWLDKNTIFEGLVGSHAYGLNTPESDMDYKGVCIPPKDYFIGLYNFDQTEYRTPDETIFNIKKYIKLLVECNPNLTEMLFLSDDCIIKSSKYWETLVENRDLFLTKKAKFTYSGYAYAQLKRVRSHKEWLLNPINHKPTRSEFGLPEQQKISADYIGAIESIVREQTKLTQEDIENNSLQINVESDFIPTEIMQLYEKERRYRNAKKKWDQYQNWIANRNPKRAALEAKYGMDLKHVGHVFRLLIQGEEILSKGTLTVKLKDGDRDYILDIKNGKYSYEEIMEMVEINMKSLDELYSTCKLPHSANINKINNIMVGIIEEFWRKE